jgi:hypothetical protein
VAHESRTQLWLIHLGTGTVTRRVWLPARQTVSGLQGRLNDTTVLASMATTGAGPGGRSVAWLGALDLPTLTVRRLVGTTGHRAGVAEY